MKTLIICTWLFIMNFAACNQQEDPIAVSIAPTSSNSDSSGFIITSGAVQNGELLPQYKCEKKVNGVENSIPLAWTNVPEGTGSLAIIMIHYPNPSDLSHLNSYLLLWGISPSVTEIPYGKANTGPWFIGTNKDGTAVSYTSPCSPSSGSHEYTITIYALDKTPESLPKYNTIDVNYGVLMKALSTVNIIDSAKLIFKNVTP